MCAFLLSALALAMLNAQTSARPAPVTPSRTVSPSKTYNVTVYHEPANVVRSLKVQVITGAAGSCDDVWFSIGPLGWKLDNAHRDTGNSHAGCGALSVHCAEEAAKHVEHETERQVQGLCLFHAGANDTYELPVPALQPPLTTDDIVLLGLQKKGIGGLYGAPDSPPGDWGPHKITLFVNGRPYPDSSCCLVNKRLAHNHATWVTYLKPGQTEEDHFVRSLRVLPNEKLNKMSEDVAFLTTKFGKERGISGWLAQPVGVTCATGNVKWTPGISNDGLATIDLGVDKLEVTKSGPAATPQVLEYFLDGQHGIAHQRFIRVEYLYHGSPLPRAGQRARICGEVYRDTDYEGWYEIHPRGASDVTMMTVQTATGPR
jgi:hypothetical protein